MKSTFIEENNQKSPRWYITMTTITKGLTYSANCLCNIRLKSKSTEFFPSFHLDRVTRSWIIALGVRSHYKPYRGSRGGKNHFYRIHTIVSSIGTQSNRPRGTNRPRTIDHSNLQSLSIHQKTQHHNKTLFWCNGALINYWSVTNKTQHIQLEIRDNNPGICALTETWIKEGDDITPLQLCPSGYKAISIPQKNRIGQALTIVRKESINLKHNND